MAHGKPCPYCERKMQRGHLRLAPTWDHVIPYSRGGREKIICCAWCNTIKGDMMPEEWAAFRKHVPRWWALKARERRLALAKWGPRRPLQGSASLGPVVVPPALVYGPAAESTLRCLEAPETTNAAPD